MHLIIIKCASLPVRFLVIIESCEAFVKKSAHMKPAHTFINRFSTSFLWKVMGILDTTSSLFCGSDTYGAISFATSASEFLHTPIAAMICWHVTEPP
mmetsp:Transcript_15325/g.27794  ORF Transcript_15325/g.27794 Transcript_15325/m.27794 type:complete len:97 (+) Transcript_15325:164-454(+)